MNKRLSFIWILGASALIWSGCDGGNACDTAQTTVTDTCGDMPTGGWMCAPGVADACNTCVMDHLAAGESACGTLYDTCRTACCGMDEICPPREDAGMPEDAGGDEDVPPAGCGTVGQIGGQCRSGTVCATGVTCFEELSTGMGGAPITLGLFGIESGTEDPANPDEYIASGMGSTVPINFGPGGQCSRACNPAAMDDGCGMCATCSRTLGGSDAWGAVGITVRSFDLTMTVDDANPGICRLNCQYDPASNGGCPTGYTCDPGENICVEACIETSQCNVGWGISRAEGLVAYEVDGAPYTCNDTTGQCEWTGPATAALNSECEENSDCPSPGGICLLGGRCATLACSDAAGMAAGPVACDGVCLGFGGNNGSICLSGCATADDCFPGQACSLFDSPLPSGEAGYCFAVCADNTECRSTERCHEIREDDPDTAADDSLDICDPICDPDPADATVIDGAITCETDEICTQDGTNDWGYCEPQGQLCFADDGCNGTQACEVLRDDFYGRCVDGCLTDADCATDTYCRIQPDSTYGVCRPADAECAPSPVGGTSGAILQPLRGDAQCAPGQTCSATMPDVLGTCTGTVTPSGCPGAGGATCGTGETCEAGGCTCGTTTSASGQACTTAGFVCVAGTTCGCDEDADCQGNSTVGAVSCDTATGLCSCTAVTCAAGEVCDTTTNLCTTP